ncbi:hypothetical protein NFC79_11965 [Providencia stuartii]|nr:hypothetical protein NFC79_11965 [Providencia stuartii]
MKTQLKDNFSFQINQDNMYKNIIRNDKFQNRILNIKNIDPDHQGFCTGLSVLSAQQLLKGNISNFIENIKSLQQTVPVKADYKYYCIPEDTLDDLIKDQSLIDILEVQKLHSNDFFISKIYLNFTEICNKLFIKYEDYDMTDLDGKGVNPDFIAYNDLYDVIYTEHKLMTNHSKDLIYNNIKLLVSAIYNHYSKNKEPIDNSYFNLSPNLIKSIMNRHVTYFEQLEIIKQIIYKLTMNVYDNSIKKMSSMGIQTRNNRFTGCYNKTTLTDMMSIIKNDRANRSAYIMTTGNHTLFIGKETDDSNTDSYLFLDPNTGLRTFSSSESFSAHLSLFMKENSEKYIIDKNTEKNDYEFFYFKVDLATPELDNIKQDSILRNRILAHKKYVITNESNNENVTTNGIYHDSFNQTDKIITLINSHSNSVGSKDKYMIYSNQLDSDKLHQFIKNNHQSIREIKSNLFINKSHKIYHIDQYPPVSVFLTSDNIDRFLGEPLNFNKQQID